MAVPRPRLDTEGVENLFARQCRVVKFGEADWDFKQLYAVDELIDVFIMIGRIVERLPPKFGLAFSLQTGVMIGAPCIGVAVDLLRDREQRDGWLCPARVRFRRF